MPPDSDRVSAALRQTVAERAKNYCEYCQCPEDFSPDSFTVDHIKPRQADGETTAENLAWSCCHVLAAMVANIPEQPTLIRKRDRL